MITDAAGLAMAAQAQVAHLPLVSAQPLPIGHASYVTTAPAYVDASLAPGMAGGANDQGDALGKKNAWSAEEDTVLIAVVAQEGAGHWTKICLLYTSPSPRDLSTSRMPSSA